MLSAIAEIERALKTFREHNQVVRGRLVDYMAVNISNGGYQIEAIFSGRAGAVGVAQSVLNPAADYAVCDFTTAEQLVVVLAGDDPPAWILGDE